MQSVVTYTAKGPTTNGKTVLLNCQVRSGHAAKAVCQEMPRHGCFTLFFRRKLTGYPFVCAHPVCASLCALPMCIHVHFPPLAFSVWVLAPLLPDQHQGQPVCWLKCRQGDQKGNRHM